jgi:hypothetical protein
MRNPICYTALGVALFAGATAANAQTVITRDISSQPVETVITQQPVQTVQTVETVRTVRAAAPVVRHRVVTTRTTTVRRTVTPAPAIVARSAPSYPQPLYDQAVAPAPIARDWDYSRPLYDEVVPAPIPPAPVPAATVVDDTLAGPAVGPNTAIPYRYIYEPDRILVVDPATNLTIQAIPR